MKPYTQEHCAQTVIWLCSEDIANTFGITYKVTEKSHADWLVLQNNLIMWAIYSNDIYVGNTSLRIIPRHKKAYFEIYIGDDTCRGKGVGKAALCLVIDYGFNVLGLNRIYLYTHVANQAANNLYQKVGFVREGIERQALLTAEGQFKDQIMWGLLHKDWEGFNG
ncbi:MAG: GNAT family N-acetyltransferase [Oceanospirillaceae bacterium]|nr:GNAT family N-acetyltransferase [Oceanospirillaceae bacterium]MCP5350103.1 GNAT family N-acetyltransferase [Oceanospirillaceae bacterium]